MGAAFVVAPIAGVGLILAPDDVTVIVARYKQATPDDAITRLQRRIDDGKVTLAYDPDRGYLPAVLKALHIPTSSQVLVFSKTSVQKELISPQRPRAIYFNDDTYIGYVPTGRSLEVATQDPKLGSVYFVVLQRPRAKPKFFRSVDACMECHSGAVAGRFPGNLMRSVTTDAEGTPDPTAPNIQTTDATPLSRRWGGWYVTGTHGNQRHLGNLIAERPGEASPLNIEWGANVTDLHRFFDTSLYLSPHSDIVALMVLEHQTFLQNLITQAGYETNEALNAPTEAGSGTSLGPQATQPPIRQDDPKPRLIREGQSVDKGPDHPEPGARESLQSRIGLACEPLVRAMLFSGETRLTAPIVGTSGFAEQFGTHGPFDRKHRSLRQLDLKRRLLRYPCSYTIYSEAFDALPVPAKDYVFKRLWQILSGQDHSPEFAHLSVADRKAVREILLETKPAFAAWKARERQRS
jgi:hypothetical protein